MALRPWHSRRSEIKASLPVRVTNAFSKAIRREKIFTWNEPDEKVPKVIHMNENEGLFFEYFLSGDFLRVSIR
jgi:hypothetical protein